MKRLKDILPEQIYLTFLNKYKDLTNGHARKFYSQEGEDIILLREFESENKGFYVDVGAYHPKRFSNTYLFYKKGWNGINIDARPGSMKKFNKTRPRDINLEIPISDKKEFLLFYTFNEPAVSGFLEDLSLERAKKDGYKIVRSEKMETKTLEEIFDKYLPTNKFINFLSIDVEGFDFKVLKSNNWNKYRPKVVLFEAIGDTIIDLLKSDSFLFMKDKGYVPFAKTVNTIFYKLID
jgi:FkbM family methyltransferase